jgi:trimethylamine--corrinoid protein Co-methyltransferase
METQRPAVTLLSKSTIASIMAESTEVLHKIGVTIEDPETLDILGQMGAEIIKDETKAKISPRMVESAIASAPKELTLYDMAGNEHFGFGDGQIHFNPGSAALFIHDAHASVMRPPTIEDAARFSKLAHTLEHIEAVSTGVIPADVPKNVSDSIRLFISCLYSTKPVVTGTFSEQAFDVMRDLLLARTGKDSLRGAPCAIFDVCPTSPLRWSHIGCHDLRLCAQNAIPAELIAMPLAGALSPMNLLATVVQHTVETLSGIVIHQAWTPGSPIIYGGSPAIFDMRHSTSPMGAIETLLVDIAYAEVGKSLGLPTQAYLGMSDAKALDAQAGLETSMTVTMAAAGAVDFVSGPGMINFESCQCLEKLVLDNDICGMARRFKRGLEPTGKTLAADAIAEGLREGNFLTTSDTLRLYKEEVYYPTAIIDRKPLKEAGKVDSRRLIDHAHAQVEKRLAEYEQPPVDETKLKDMVSVMKKALGAHRLEDLADRILKL